MAENARPTSCSICKDEFDAVKAVSELTCHKDHVFHTECIHDWVVESKGLESECPICRSHIFPEIKEEEHDVIGELLNIEEFVQRLEREMNERPLYIRIYRSVFESFAERQNVQNSFSNLTDTMHYKTLIPRIIYIWSALVYFGFILELAYPYRHLIAAVERCISIKLERPYTKLQSYACQIVAHFIDMNFWPRVLNETLLLHWYTTYVYLDVIFYALSVVFYVHQGIMNSVRRFAFKKL